MTRSILRRIRWTVTPDTEPDAEPVTVTMQCAVCEETSGIEKERAAAQEWCLTHSARNPSHRTYREMLTLPYRTFPDGCP